MKLIDLIKMKRLPLRRFVAACKKHGINPAWLLARVTTCELLNQPLPIETNLKT